MRRLERISIFSRFLGFSRSRVCVVSHSHFIQLTSHSLRFTRCNETTQKHTKHTGRDADPADSHTSSQSRAAHISLALRLRTLRPTSHDEHATQMQMPPHACTTPQCHMRSAPTRTRRRGRRTTSTITTTHLPAIRSPPATHRPLATPLHTCHCRGRASPLAQDASYTVADVQWRTQYVLCFHGMLS